jgi:VCBS repeat-containing protein
VVNDQNDPKLNSYYGWTTTNVLANLMAFLKNADVPVKTFAQMEGYTQTNRIPVAVNDSYSTNEDTALTVAAPGVLNNDTDADGNSLTAALVSNPAHGTLTLNSNGSFIYTPSTNYNGSDNFTYKANDGKANSNTATVAITVRAVNDAPVAVNDAYSVNEDTALTVAAPGVLNNDTDADGNSLTAALVTGPAHGTLNLSAKGSFTYTPNAGYSGADLFTYRASDGTTNSNTATVTITINQTGITATFGLDSGNYSGTEGSDMIDVMRFQNTAGTGTLTKLEILFNDTTPNGKVRLGVYADNNGVPGALLLDAGEVAVANGWVSIAGLNYSVTQGTYYWLAFGLQRDNGVTYQAGQPDRSHYWINYYYGALPSQYNLNGDRYGCNNGQFVIRATVPTANVNFKVVVTGVSGTDLSRTVTAQVTNTGSSDAHNAWAKIEVFSQSQRIQLSGQDYLSVNIGTVKAGATVTEQATLSFSLLDSLKIQQNGAQFLLTLYSDEWTQTLTYDYKP